MPQNREPAKRSIDSESRKPRVTTRKMFTRQPPPPQNESESDEHISSDTDQELEKQLDLPRKDDTRRKTMKSKTLRPREIKDTAEQTALHSQKESDTAEKSLQNAPHMIMYAAVYHMRTAPLTYPQTSTYIPSFYMFFFALQSAHAIVHENTYLRYLSPQYLTIASKLYYAILGIIQILRTKVTAGIITRPESQALRRFEREFPFESLPIMSPLIMFFQNLGAVKLADPMYSWICPTFPEKIGTTVNTNGIFANSDNIMLPNVPALIRFLHEIGTANAVTDITNVNGRIAPASAVAGNPNFFGINFSALNDGDTQRLIYSSGWLEPPELPESIDVKVIKRIGRWNLPTLTSTTDLSTIGQFIQTDGNMEWFSRLINLTTEESKFFKGSTNLAAISTTSTLTSLVEVTHKDQTTPKVPNEKEWKSFTYPFSTVNFPSDLWKFEINTTRGETKSDELKIGSTTQFLVTNFGNLTPIQHATPAPTLSGPYFGTPLQARQVHQIESDTTRSPRTAFEQLIRENLYDETGGQTPTFAK